MNDLFELSDKLSELLYSYLESICDIKRSKRELTLQSKKLATACVIDYYHNKIITDFNTPIRTSNSTSTRNCTTWEMGNEQAVKTYLKELFIALEKHYPKISKSLFRTSFEDWFSDKLKLTYGKNEPLPTSSVKEIALLLLPSFFLHYIFRTSKLVQKPLMKLDSYKPIDIGKHYATASGALAEWIKKDAPISVLANKPENININLYSLYLLTVLHETLNASQNEDCLFNLYFLNKTSDYIKLCYVFLGDIYFENPFNDDEEYEPTTLEPLLHTNHLCLFSVIHSNGYNMPSVFANNNHESCHVSKLFALNIQDSFSQFTNNSTDKFSKRATLTETVIEKICTISNSFLNSINYACTLEMLSEFSKPFESYMKGYLPHLSVDDYLSYQNSSSCNENASFYFENMENYYQCLELVAQHKNLEKLIAKHEEYLKNNIDSLIAKVSIHKTRGFKHPLKIIRRYPINRLSKCTLKIQYSWSYSLSYPTAKETEIINKQVFETLEKYKDRRKRKRKPKFKKRYAKFNIRRSSNDILNFVNTDLINS